MSEKSGLQFSDLSLRNCRDLEEGSLLLVAVSVTDGRLFSGPPPQKPLTAVGPTGALGLEPALQLGLGAWQLRVQAEKPRAETTCRWQNPTNPDAIWVAITHLQPSLIQIRNLSQS